MWLVVLIWLRDRHPRLIDESEPLGAGRRTVGVVLAVIFIPLLHRDALYARLTRPRAVAVGGG